MNELENEIKKTVLIEKVITLSVLSIAAGALNNQIKFNGLNSWEIPYQGDQFTGKQYFKMIIFHLWNWNKTIAIINKDSKTTESTLQWSIWLIKSTKKEEEEKEVAVY